MTKLPIKLGLQIPLFDFPGVAPKVKRAAGPSIPQAGRQFRAMVCASSRDPSYVSVTGFHAAPSYRT